MEYFDILFSNTGAVIIVIILLVIIAAVSFFSFRYKIFAPKEKNNNTARVNSPVVTKQAAQTAKIGSTLTVSGEKPTNPAIKLGKGEYKCIAIRSPKLLGYDSDINIVDFTTMPEQLGELHFADTSCPVSGGVYTVIEKPDGTLTDYDPRLVIMDVKTTPEMAYQATHWAELSAVWGTQVSILKNPSLWLAIGGLVIMFFIAAQAMGA
jgi:hypothetical protein